MKRLHDHGQLWRALCSVLILFSFQPLILSQTAYNSKSGTVTFYSHAPIEDITATTDQVTSAINPSDGSISVKVPISSFAFRKQLMKKHFNEQYMLTEEFPYSEFSGKLVGDLNNILSTGTKTDTRVSGNLTIRGITKPVNENVTLLRKGNDLEGSVRFKVKPEDYGIKIPRMLKNNIAEEIEVTAIIVYQLNNPSR